MTKWFLLALFFLILPGCTTQQVKSTPVNIGLGVYGNWCGLNHPKDIDDAADPIDELDASCKRHDLCYVAEGQFSCACDQVLSSELEVSLLANRYQGSQKLFAQSFFHYMKSSFCNGDPSHKTTITRTLHDIYQVTSEKASDVVNGIGTSSSESSENPQGVTIVDKSTRVKNKRR
jgi:hypothetical protein